MLGSNRGTRADGDFDECRGPEYYVGFYSSVLDYWFHWVSDLDFILELFFRIFQRVFRE